MALGFTNLQWSQAASSGAVTGTAEAAIGTSTTIPGSGSGSVADGSGASFWTVGKTLNLWAAGKITTAASSQGNVTFTFRLDTTGGTSIAATAATALGASQTNITWVLEAMLTCETIGTSGGILLIGSINFSTALTTNVVVQIPASAPATATIDTTANHQILLDATLGSASDSITLMQYCGIALN